MFSFFKKKKSETAQRYRSAFKNTKSKSFETTRFVVFDTETTGLNLKNDRILSIGAVSIIGKTIQTSDSFEVYIKQQKFDATTVKIHGILKAGNIQKISEQQALEQFLQYIANAVLVAHHIDFDFGIINKALQRAGLPSLQNSKVDTGLLYKKLLNHSTQPSKHYSLDDLCSLFKVPLHDRHNALGDAYITALVFRKIVRKLQQQNPMLQLHQILYTPERHGLL